jgi:hypothetical protein
MIYTDEPEEYERYIDNLMRWSAQGAAVGVALDLKRKLAKDATLGGTQARLNGDTDDCKITSAKALDAAAAMDTLTRIAKGMDKPTWDALYDHAHDTGEGQFSGGENLAPRGSSAAGGAKKMQPHSGGTLGSQSAYDAAATKDFY